MKTKFARSRLIFFGCLILAMTFFSLQSQASESFAVAGDMRCGWFSNPTPANASLYDRDAEWIIGVQGGHQAEGDWPEFGAGQWVKTNGNYGYGCACLRLQANTRTHEVSVIESAQPRALSACRKDAALKRWDFK